jgi:hypothetical protein
MLPGHGGRFCDLVAATSTWSGNLQTNGDFEIDVAVLPSTAARASMAAVSVDVDSLDAPPVFAGDNHCTVVAGDFIVRGTFFSTRFDGRYPYEEQCGEPWGLENYGWAVSYVGRL